MHHQYKSASFDQNRIAGLLTKRTAIVGLVFLLFTACLHSDSDGGDQTPVIRIDASGEGHVESDPAGIDCGQECTARFERETWFSLTAVPADGWAVESWSGVCEDADNNFLPSLDPSYCQFTVEGNERIAVEFKPHPPQSVALAAGDTSVTIDWDALDVVDQYRLYFSTESGFEPENYAIYDDGTLVPDVNPPHEITNLKPHTRYYFRLTAEIGGIRSQPSNEIAATTGGTQPPLNDTGIDRCANKTSNDLDCPVADHPGQDGDFGRDAAARAGDLEKVGSGDAGFDFTKLDANGNELAAEATEWSCVRDNHTGLIWEVKTNDGGLHDKNNTYSWYNPDGPREPGYPDEGNCVGSDCDTLGYVEAVNSRGLCGASDWRMPTTIELHSLVHFGRAEPAIDTDFFPNTAPAPYSNTYWTGEYSTAEWNSAWRVNFDRGSVGWKLTSVLTFVRLVRTED